MADVISLRGLRVLGVHGLLPEERARAQPFEVDVDLEADVEAAGRTDALEDTVDYGEFARAVAEVVGSERHGLLERIAQRIADAALADGRVRRATVTVRKLRPPVPVDLDHVAVTIVRER